MGCSWEHQGGFVSLKPHPLNCWVQLMELLQQILSPLPSAPQGSVQHRDHLCLPREVQPVLVSP